MEKKSFYRFLKECWENGESWMDSFGRIGNDVAKELEVFCSDDKRCCSLSGGGSMDACVA